MITYRDSGVADRPHAAVVHHRLEDDPGYLGLAARAFVAWDAVHVDPWLIGCCVTSGQAHERESAGRQLLRAYERSCSHTIHVDGWDGPILQIFGLWSNDYEGLEEARDESQPLAEPRLLNHRRYGLVLRANILPLLVARIYIKPCGLFRQILFILGQAASFLMIGVA
jgi:hypothetical protein